MKLLTFEYEGREQVGVLSPDGGGVIPVGGLGYPFSTMLELIRGCGDAMLAEMALKAGEEKFPAIPLARVRLLAPIPHPARDVICMGLNYLEDGKVVAHGNSEPAAPRTWPIFFGKTVDRARGDGEEIPSHSDFVSTLDYECELAAVIKKDARKVPPEKVGEYIFGYTILNDVSARELTRHKQNYFLKGLDGACPMGPWIVTADEIAFPPKLRISLEINGEPRQNSCTDNMIFGLEVIVSTLTQGMTLQAGTIISTGSPKGSGCDMDPKVFLKDGDHIRCEIEGIGVLSSSVKDNAT